MTNSAEILSSDQLCHQINARQIIQKIAAMLPDQSWLDARWLLGLALGGDRPVHGHDDICLDEKQAACLTQLVAARQKGQPISRMRGYKEFWSLKFYLNPATLDPRPDSETLVEAALEFASKSDYSPATNKWQILDLGTGSGCLLLSLLSELPDGQGLGIDMVALAIAQARANAAALGLSGQARFETGHWTDSISQKFDIILSNPPYINTTDKDQLSNEVRAYDPHLALFAGPDGLDAYRQLMPRLGIVLAQNGRAFIELGAGQLESVALLANASNLKVLDVRKDLSNRPRCLIIGL